MKDYKGYLKTNQLDEESDLDVINEKRQGDSQFEAKVEARVRQEMELFFKRLVAPKNQE